MFKRTSSEIKFIKEKIALRLRKNTNSEENESEFTRFLSKISVKKQKVLEENRKTSKSRNTNRGISPITISNGPSSIKMIFEASRSEMAKLPKLMIQKQKLHIKENSFLPRNQSNNSVLSHRHNSNSSRSEITSRRRTIFKELSENHYKHHKKNSEKLPRSEKLKDDADFDLVGWNIID